ncbi:radical SAM protein [Fulvivirgaceae bacterium BMA12]|uniref:Radical SAM protein n=1 Tax=Agaribacillus aureus TaxID=3051825 RepID=A0ABT8L834_9BACT|nr:radical SAM protein [Fulvivirgaceae bacterium BMA12]
MSRKVFQLHPSQFCNYSCLHCYSSSSPHIRSYVDKNLIAGAIKDAASLGYQRLSVSGGEPLLYPYLTDILSAAKNHGMSTSLITNGSFPEGKYKSLIGLVDVIGVSLDGTKELHNTIRKNRSAFEKVDRFLDFSVKYFKNIGIVFALTDQSWEFLPDIFSYGKSRNVSIIQIHPLERVGRAKSSNGISLSLDNLKRAYLLNSVISSQYPFYVQFDALSKDTAIRTMTPKDGIEVAAEAIDLLVMNEKGEVLPYTYGIPNNWQVANLNKTSLNEGWQYFKENKFLPFQKWCEDTIGSIKDVLFTPSTIYAERSFIQRD